jgi:hypothetical protein
MISLVAPKRNEMIEHPKVFRASRMGCLNTAANRVFTARSCKMDYTYDPPQHDYEHARWPCVPEECEFSVIGVVNQRFRPVPQETFTINSGEINGVFHRHICDYDSMSGVFVWPNRDPLGEPGFETLHLVTQPLFIRKLRLNINDSEMQYFLAMAIQSGGINIADYLRNSHASYTGNTISTLEFLNFLVSGQATYAPNWPVELLEYPNLFGFVGNDPIDDLDPNGLWNPFKAIWNWLNKPQRPPSNAPTSCSVGPWTGNDPWGSYGPKIYGVQVTIYIKGQ